jgi:signal transduction histidine kinase
MKRFWLHSLTGQLIGLMFLALILSQAITFLLSYNEWARSLTDTRRDDFLSRSASIAELLATTDTTLHPGFLRAVATPYNSYWITSDSTVAPLQWQETARERLLRGQNLPHTAKPFKPGDLQISAATWSPITGGNWPTRYPAQLLELKNWNGFGLIVKVREGLYLHASYAKPDYLIQSPSRYYVSLGVTALTLALVSVLIARRISRPLQRLTDSADRLGRGEEVLHLPEEGAEDIRRTAAAFNRMQLRIRRFVEDRTQMIAAISHDLRTPITSLRLRAEFVEDPEMKEKFIATLDEMQMMTESVLAFAREDAAVEPSRTVDIAALLAGLCDDLVELGWDVTFVGGDRTPFRCRPDGLKRALRNIIENAVRYGERARLQLKLSAEWLEILVEDHGPGITEKDFERVFAPFVRLESSRNRATGGVGLGLAIARSILRAHGGDAHLANRPEGGLRVTIRLPQAIGHKIRPEPVPAGA